MLIPQSVIDFVRAEVARDGDARAIAYGPPDVWVTWAPAHDRPPYGVQMVAIATPTEHGVMIGEFLFVAADLIRTEQRIFDAYSGVLPITSLAHNPVLRSLGRKCFPKEQHRTQVGAEAQLRSLVKRDLRKNVTAHTYQCPFCRYWHVGHQVKS